MTYEEIVKTVIDLGRSSESAITGDPSDIDNLKDAFSAIRNEIELGRNYCNRFKNLRSRIERVIKDG